MFYRFVSKTEVNAGRLTGNFNKVIFFLLIMLLVRVYPDTSGRPTATCGDCSTTAPTEDTADTHYF